MRVFLDCPCDADYTRTEIDWVEYVRDRADADVHILGTSVATGSGGREYQLYFLGLGAFEARSDTILYVTSPDDTDDVRRQGIVRTLKIGLMRYVANTPLAGLVEIEVELPDESALSSEEQQDPWNNWVFSISANGFFNGESQQQFGNYGLSLSATRTTDDWKIRWNARSSYSESVFELDSMTTVRSIRRSYDSGVLIARTIGPRLSAGMELSAESSTFGNVEVAYRLASALEWDFYPYSESTRRLFTAQYSVGVNSFDYRELTIFDQIGETRPAHSFALFYTTRQPWGSTSAGLSASQFLHDLSKYRWTANANGSIRLFRGLSLNLGGTYSRVRDQLALPAGDATHDEILLRQRLLSTSYTYFMNFSLSYRFGSIFNNVVNPRFARGVGAGSSVF